MKHNFETNISTPDTNNLKMATYVDLTLNNLHSIMASTTDNNYKNLRSAVSSCVTSLQKDWQIVPDRAKVRADLLSLIEILENEYASLKRGRLKD